MQTYYINTFKIEEFLIKNDLTKSEFCKRVHVSPRDFNLIMSGKPNIPLNMLPFIKIALFMKVKVKDLIIKSMF